MAPPPVQLTRFVAIDVHKDYVMVGAVDVQQQIVLPPRRLSMIEFEDWAPKRLTKSDSVVLEATTNAWHLVDQLQPYAGAVTVAHPLLVKLISAARVKTDTRDTINLARLLAARYCQLNPQTKKWVCRPREICIIEEVSPAFWSTRSPSLLPLSCSKPQTVPAWRHARVVPRGDGGADKSARDEAPARQATVGHGPLI